MKFIITNLFTISIIILFIKDFYTSVYAADPVLKYSINSDRSSQLSLSGINVDGNIYVTLPSLKSEKLTLSWIPNLDLNNSITDGYIVYQGTTTTNMIKLGKKIPHDSTKFKTFSNSLGKNDLKVWVSYIDSEFNVDNTLQICFRLKAFNSIGTSAFSKTLCTILNRIKSVSFYIDDETLSGAPISIKTDIPYDLSGTNKDGSAKPFDTTKLNAGQHVITALIIYKKQQKTLKVSGVINVVKKLLTPKGMEVLQELLW